MNTHFWLERVKYEFRSTELSDFKPMYTVLITHRCFKKVFFLTGI